MILFSIIKIFNGFWDFLSMNMTSERNIQLMIELDQVGTWPVQILKILENRASFIKDEREREEQSLCDGSYILNKIG